MFGYSRIIDKEIELNFWQVGYKEMDVVSIYLLKKKLYHCLTLKMMKNLWKQPQVNMIVINVTNTFHVYSVGNKT